MKNVFGNLYDKSRDTTRCDGERFITARTDLQFNKELEAFSSDAVDVAESAVLPLWLQIIRGICCFGGICLILSISKNIGELSFAEMFHNAPVLLSSCSVAAVLWIALSVYERIKLKRVMSSAELKQVEHSFDELNARSEKELNVPSDYVKVDVLSFEYTVKNGKEKLRDQIYYSYSNDEMKLFKQGDNLCLADMQAVYSIPISDCKKYILKKRRAHVDTWNKDEPFNKGEYKQYRIKAEDDDSLHVKYYALQISDVFGEYELFFPEYELKAFKAIANVPDDIE